MQPVLEIRNLTFRLQGLSIIENLDLTVQPGQIVAILGPSGCGKTSLLHLIAALHHASGGEINRNHRRPAYVFQEDRLFPWLTAYDNVKAVNPSLAPKAVKRLLGQAGLSGFERYTPERLSGGMRQRCAIARAYAYPSDLLLMDEPFSALDQTLREDFALMLRELQAESGKAILFVTHNVDEAFAIAHRVVLFSPRPARIIKDIDLAAADRPAETIKREILELYQ